MSDIIKPHCQIICENVELEEAAKKLAAEYGFSFSALPLSNPGLVLQQDGLYFFDPKKPKEKLHIDFTAGKTGYRLSTIKQSAQPLLKAIGYKKDKEVNILDATAGLGGDGMLLACIGCKVTLIEQSPVIAALLADGLKRASENEELSNIINQHIRLIYGNSITLIPELADEIDVVYLDPMFPERKKSALVKKEMRLTKLVTDQKDNAEELLMLARKHAGRVVIKRPIKAPIVASDYSMQIKGRSIRFDVYTKKP